MTPILAAVAIAFVGLVGVLFGVAVGILLLRQRQVDPTVVGAHRAPQETGSDAPPNVKPRPATPVAGGEVQVCSYDAVSRDRAVLVDVCIWLRNRLKSEALIEGLDAALDEAGVRMVQVEGADFDPGRHEAGSVTPTADPGLDGTIFCTESPGWMDRGKLVRPPVVAVYRTYRR